MQESPAPQRDRFNTIVVSLIFFVLIVIIAVSIGVLRQGQAHTNLADVAPTDTVLVVPSDTPGPGTVLPTDTTGVTLPTSGPGTVVPTPTDTVTPGPTPTPTNTPLPTATPTPEAPTLTVSPLGTVMCACSVAYQNITTILIHNPGSVPASYSVSDWGSPNNYWSIGCDCQNPAQGTIQPGDTLHFTVSYLNAPVVPKGAAFHVTFYLGSQNLGTTDVICNEGL